MHRSQIVTVHMHACSRASECRGTLIFGLLSQNLMLLRVIIHHKLVLTPACDACISEADCDSVCALSTASDPCSAQACGAWSAVSCRKTAFMYAFESILNMHVQSCMTCVPSSTRWTFRAVCCQQTASGVSLLYNAQDSALVQCTRLSLQAASSGINRPPTWKAAECRFVRHY